MQEGRLFFGYALNSQVGLVMVGGWGRSDYFPSESTTDGIHISKGAVAAFGDEVYENCLVSADQTLISFGGNYNKQRIAKYTLGHDQWEVSSFKFNCAEYNVKLSQLGMH